MTAPPLPPPPCSAVLYVSSLCSLYRRAVKIHRPSVKRWKAGLRWQSFSISEVQGLAGLQKCSGLGGRIRRMGAFTGCLTRTWRWICQEMMEPGTEENRQKLAWSQDGHIWEAAEVWSIIPSSWPLKTLLYERAPWGPRSYRDKHDPNPFIYSFSSVRVGGRRGCCEPVYNTGSHIRRRFNVVSLHFVLQKHFISNLLWHNLTAW